MDEKQRQQYAELLDSLWGRYMTFVNFFITAAGGTVLIVFANVLGHYFEYGDLPKVPAMFWIGTCLAGICSISCMFWKGASHRYMEYELLAPFGAFEDYIGSERIAHTVTNVHRFEQSGFRHFIKTTYKWAATFNLVLLGTSWMLLALAMLEL